MKKSDQTESKVEDKSKQKHKLMQAPGGKNQETQIGTPPPPLLFKVEKVLGVHACPYSNKAFMKEFVEKYGEFPMLGNLNLKDSKGQKNASLQVPLV